MPSIVFYNPARHIIEQTYEGDQDEHTVTEGAARLQTIIDKLKLEKNPAHVLLNITDVGSVSKDGQEAAVTVLKQLTFDKLAVYGANTYLNGLARVIIAATGKGNIIKVFGDKFEAERWLTEDDKKTP